MKWSKNENTLVTKIFSNIEMFGHSTLTVMGLHVSVNYPHTIVKKMVSPKNAWMGHCLDFSKGGGIKKGKLFEKREVNTIIEIQINNRSTRRRCEIC